MCGQSSADPEPSGDSLGPIPSSWVPHQGVNEALLQKRQLQLPGLLISIAMVTTHTDLHSNSHHFLLLRAVPSTPVQFHTVCTSFPADSQCFACLQVAGSVSRWSFTAVLAWAAPGRLLTARLMHSHSTAAHQLQTTPPRNQCP